MTRIFVFAIVALTLSSFTLAQNEPADPLTNDPAIINFQRGSEEIAFAGQPTEEGFRKLKNAGFKTVLNLRRAEEFPFDEPKLLEELGLAYHHIPIGSAESITDEKVATFTEIVNDPDNKPLLIHCASSNRVGGLWYIYRSLDDDQVTAEQALEEAAEAGLQSPMLKQIVIDYVKEKLRP